MQEMTDAHRLFLQFFMSKGVLNASEVKKMFHYSCERFGMQLEDDQLAAFVLTINNRIKPMHLEIKKGVCEQSEVHYYGLVNTAESDITLSSSDYTAGELEFFKKVVEKIVSSEGEVSSMEALNIVNEVEKLNKKQAEDILERLTREKWLIKNAGQYSLSVRSMLELEHYIEEQHPDDAVKCNMCKKLVVRGLSCPQCDVKLHMVCARHCMKDPTNPSCPDKRCAAKWPEPLPPKQSSRKQRDDDPQPSTSGEAVPSRKRSSRN